MSEAKVDFDIAFCHLMGWEDAGNTGKVTTDAGGATRYGISQAAYPSLYIPSLTLPNAYQIYKRDFWFNIQWNITEWTSQAAANKFLQLGVNLGIGIARQFGIIAQYLMYDADNGIPFKYDPQKRFIFTPQLNLANTGWDYRELIDIVAAMQLSRYMKDYHTLHNVPDQLIRRAASLGREKGWKTLPPMTNQLSIS
jgi:hypothetical protein